MAKGRGRRGATQKSSRGRGAGIREEVPQDSIDAFHASRDKILLDDGADHDSDEYDFGGDTHEVLGMDTQDVSEEEEKDEGEEYEDDEGYNDADLDRYRTMMLPAGYEDSLRRRAARDEAHDEQEDEEEDVDENEEEGENAFGWGANKHSYYSGNTVDGFESDSDMDEDKARELEKNEALRLQRQSRAGMSDAEFGLDSIHADDMQMAANEQSEAARAKRRRELDTDEDNTADANLRKSPEELVSSIQRRVPIVLALIDEFRDALRQLREEGAFVDTITKDGEQQVAEIAHLYIQSLSNYAMMLAFFFQLAAEPSMQANPERLLTHPVMSRLAQFKKALVEMKELGLFEPRSADAGVSDDSDRVMGAPTSEDAAFEELGELEPNELEGLLADAKADVVPMDAAEAKKAVPIPLPSEKKKKKAKKATAEKARGPEPSVLADVAGVEAADISLSKKNALPLQLEDADAYGEPTQMRDTEMQDKAQRRRAVQFHASGLDTKPANKKKQLEGDMDIPYRDKRQIRDAVSTAKANRLAKGKEMADAGLSGADWGESDWDARRAVMDEGEDEDGDGSDDAAEYYDLVSSRKRARKAAQKDEHDQQRLASRVYDDDVLAPGDHRSIDYTIDKNKGLTASRPKSIRNPRLKRRMRYDRAKKRLSSTRAVYKGGQSALQGGYGGEASGISTHLVKSRKLGS